MQVFIKDLDSLDIDLNEILGQLKTIALDPGFDAVNAVELRQNPPKKSLHDFVDEQGIEDLKGQLRQVRDVMNTPGEIIEECLSELHSVEEQANAEEQE